MKPLVILFAAALLTILACACLFLARAAGWLS